MDTSRIGEGAVVMGADITSNNAVTDTTAIGTCVTETTGVGLVSSLAERGYIDSVWMVI